MNDYFDYVSKKLQKVDAKAPTKEPPPKVDVIDMPEEQEPEPKQDGGDILVEESEVSESMIKKIRNFWK